MSLPVRLDKALTKGRIVRVHLPITDNRRYVPFGCAWLILSGMISHVTGTESRVIAYDEKGHMAFMTKIDSAIETEIYPLFNAVADIQVSLFTPTIIMSRGGEKAHTANILFNGGVDSVCTIQVLEWEI